MPLADKLRPYYTINVTCENCGKPCQIRIKKGVTIIDAVKNKEMKCENCKCIIMPKTYTTQWIK